MRVMVMVKATADSGGAALAGFAVADRFMRTSSRPALWVAGAWAALPVPPVEWLAGRAGLVFDARNAVSPGPHPGIVRL